MRQAFTSALEAFPTQDLYLYSNIKVYLNEEVPSPKYQLQESVSRRITDLILLASLPSRLQETWEANSASNILCATSLQQVVSHMSSRYPPDMFKDLRSILGETQPQWELLLDLSELIAHLPHVTGVKYRAIKYSWMDCEYDGL